MSLPRLRPPLVEKKPGIWTYGDGQVGPRTEAFSRLFGGAELKPLDRAIIEGEFAILEAEINFLRAALAPFAAGHVCDEVLSRSIDSLIAKKP